MELRLILLLIGVIVIGVVYYTSRPEAESRAEDAEDLATAANRADPEDPIDAAMLDDLEGDVFMAPDGPSASVVEEIEVEPRKEPTLSTPSSNHEVIKELEKARSTLSSQPSSSQPSSSPVAEPALGELSDAEPDNVEDIAIEPVLTPPSVEPTTKPVAEPAVTQTAKPTIKPADAVNDAFDDYDDEPLFPELDDHELGALAEPVHFKHSIDRAPRRKQPDQVAPEVAESLKESTVEVETFTGLEEPLTPAPEKAVKKAAAETAEKLSESEAKEDSIAEAAPESKPEAASTESETSATNDVHVVMLYISAKQPEGMAGSTIAEIMKKHELTMNDKGLFQKLAPEGQRASFQVANMFAPGTFNAGEIATQSYEGLALFGVLPGVQAGYELMDELLFLARELEQQLDAQLLDETRSVFSPQTEQYMREQIVQFEHRQKLTAS